MYIIYFVIICYLFNQLIYWLSQIIYWFINLFNLAHSYSTWRVTESGGRTVWERAMWGAVRGRTNHRADDMRRIWGRGIETPARYIQWRCRVGGGAIAVLWFSSFLHVSSEVIHVCWWWYYCHHYEYLATIFPPSEKMCRTPPPPPLLTSPDAASRDLVTLDQTLWRRPRGIFNITWNVTSGKNLIN